MIDNFNYCSNMLKVKISKINNNNIVISYQIRDNDKYNRFIRGKGNLYLCNKCEFKSSGYPSISINSVRAIINLPGVRKTHDTRLSIYHNKDQRSLDKRLNMLIEAFSEFSKFIKSNFEKI